MTLDYKKIMHDIYVLESSLHFLFTQSPETVLYHVFRNATFKGYELILAIMDNVLHEALNVHRPSDERNIYDIAKENDLMDAETAQRWVDYRDHVYHSIESYEEVFMAHTVKFLPNFIADSKNLAFAVEKYIRTQKKETE